MIGVSLPAEDGRDPAAAREVCGQGDAREIGRRRAGPSGEQVPSGVSRFVAQNGPTKKRSDPP